MSFSLGGKKSKGSTTGSEDSTKTSTPNVPAWLLQPTQDAAANITKLGMTDPSTLVPGEDPLQAQARVRAGGLTGSPWNFDAAADVTRGVLAKAAPTVQSASLLEGLDKYMSPYREKVVDATTADFDAAAGKTRAAQDLAIAGEGAFGGSGAALTKSATEGELSRGRATTMATLLDQMFGVGANLSGQDATRRQAAASENANLELANRAQRLAAAGRLTDISTTFDANQRANIATQAAAGETARDIATQQAQAPFNLQDWISQALAGLNPALFTGETSTINSKTSGTSKGSSFGAEVGFSAGDIGKMMKAGG